MALSTLIIVALGSYGCSKAPGASAGLTDQQIIAKLNQRIGAQACCFFVRTDRRGDAVYGPLNARREIHMILRRTLSGEAVACGFSGFPKARAFNGTAMSSGDDTTFVVRDQRLFVQRDMTPDQFDRLQDQLCGPDWVKPIPRMPVVN